MASANDTTSNQKVLTFAEVQKLAEDKKNCILIIDNHVYDITKFMDEHPGGEQVLQEQHGKDATNAFEDVGHSTDAREQMKAYEIGQLHPNDIKKSEKKPAVVKSDGNTNSVRDQNESSWTKWVIPFVIAVAAAVLFKLLVKSSPDINRPPRAI